MGTKEDALQHLKKWEEKKGKPFQTWKQVAVIASYIDFANEKTQQQQEIIERLKKTLDGVVDDFKYYISEQEEPPTRAGYLKEAKTILKELGK